MTDEQIMKHLYALADFVYGETFSTHDKYEDVRCGDSLFRIYKKDNEVLNEVKNRLVSNPWHTGTPTEEGWYLVQHLSDAEYCGSKFFVARWDGEKFIINPRPPIVVTYSQGTAWQKIEESEDGHTD